jgi:hypothetical protein
MRQADAMRIRLSVTGTAPHWLAGAPAPRLFTVFLVWLLSVGLVALGARAARRPSTFEACAHQTGALSHLTLRCGNPIRRLSA